MKTRKLLWPAIGVLLAGLALFWALKARPVPVKAIVLEPGELRVVVNATTTSTIKSEHEATLSAQRTGRVIRLAVKDGDRVREGDLIAELDLTEESVQSESVLAQSQATFNDAEKNYRRSQELAGKGMIALQDLDAARKAFEVARSQYEAARKDVKVRKDYSVIRAPFSGVVAKKFTEMGELLLPGKEIVSLVDPDKIYVLATIDEVDVGRLRLGQKVAVSVDAFPDERFDGVVRRISPIVSGGKLETRTADVWIYFTKKDGRIKPGMSADVEVLIAKLENVLSVPSQAVVDRSGKKQVFRINGNGLKAGDAAIAAAVPIEAGESNWVATEVRSGLAAGDLIITTPGIAGLRDGGKVLLEAEKGKRPAP
jgi:HlyD family secretion protein